MPTIYTIGYQNKTAALLITLLHKHGVGRVIDVRNNPASRKPDFTKKRLQVALERNGIEYVHLPELGIPKDIRLATIYRGDLSAFRRYARQRAYRHAHRIVELPRPPRGANCLLCLEEDPKECHRSVIANYVGRKWNFRVSHL